MTKYNWVTFESRIQQQWKLQGVKLQVIKSWRRLVQCKSIYLGFFFSWIFLLMQQHLAHFWIFHCVIISQSKQANFPLHGSLCIDWFQPIRSSVIQSSYYTVWIQSSYYTAIVALVQGLEHHLRVPSQYMGGGLLVKGLKGCGLAMGRKELVERLIVFSLETL